MKREPRIPAGLQRKLKKAFHLTRVTGMVLGSYPREPEAGAGYFTGWHASLSLLEHILTHGVGGPNEHPMLREATRITKGINHGEEEYTEDAEGPETDEVGDPDLR